MNSESLIRALRKALRRVAVVPRYVTHEVTGESYYDGQRCLLCDDACVRGRTLYHRPQCLLSRLRQRKEPNDG